MENEQGEILELENDEENAFGPHTKDGKHFFTTLFKDQDVSKNSLFIQWKKDMKKVNDLIIHCPNCNAYFPHEAIDYCNCEKCDFSFCFGCKKENCRSNECIKWFLIIIPFFSLKEYGDRNIFFKILMYFALLFQVLFTFPLQAIYKMGPCVAGEDGFTNRDNYYRYKKKGLIFCLVMFPYQIAFIGFWFNITALIFFIPGIIYPPYTVYMMGMFRYAQTHIHSGEFYDGHYYKNTYE